MNVGRVLVAYGSHGLIETATGEVRSGRFRRKVGRPVCGDRVAVQLIDNDELAVDEILPRDSEFMRTDHKGRPLVVAANLDQVCIVIAPQPAPTEEILDRYLVAAESLDLKPLIVLNKAELLESEPQGILSRLSYYESLGYPVIRTSCKTEPGIDALRQKLDQHSSILVGQSGVGKSALATRLLPETDIISGELSTQTGKGTHTTTTTRLYHLPDGGELIDSPGVWEFGVWNLRPGAVHNGFIEFDELARHCRFSNCWHQHEPGCAVQAAVDDGEVPERRYRAYRRLIEQAETAARDYSG